METRQARPRSVVAETVDFIGLRMGDENGDALGSSFYRPPFSPTTAQVSFLWTRQSIEVRGWDLNQDVSRLKVQHADQERRDNEPTADRMGLSMSAAI